MREQELGNLNRGRRHQSREAALVRCVRIGVLGLVRREVGNDRGRHCCQTQTDEGNHQCALDPALAAYSAALTCVQTGPTPTRTDPGKYRPAETRHPQPPARGFAPSCLADFRRRLGTPAILPAGALPQNPFARIFLLPQSSHLPFSLVGDLRFG